MHALPIDAAVVDECRTLAGRIAADVQSFIARHTTCSIERTVLRAYGVDGVDGNGVPLVNTCVERLLRGGLGGNGVAYYLGRLLARSGGTLQEAAEAIAYAPSLPELTPSAQPSAAEAAEARRALERETQAALDRIDRARSRV